jgi:NAD(P)-dependent dehydrogenase (short-subunit alcohol dehydrogenase family)
VWPFGQRSAACIGKGPKNLTDKRIFGAMNWTPRQIPDLSGRTAVVTGGNSGIGWGTALELAKHGAHVVLACRDLTKGKHAAARIVVNDARADVEVRELDLASMDSVREFGEKWAGPLDLLVNNAAVMAPPKRLRTENGFELQFGTNHLGHFVLTGLLLPSLLQGQDARVVTVSSVAHRGGRRDVLDGNAGGYRPQQSYANSKLANLLFAQELQRNCAERGLELTSTAAHPGVAATGLSTDPQGIGANRIVRYSAPLITHLILQSAAAGARPVLYAAVAALPGSYTGPQWMKETRGRVGPARLSSLAADPTLARRLWEVSEELTGFRYLWPRTD